MTKKLAIIVPSYNEEEIIRTSVNELNSVMDKMIQDGLVSPSSYISFVDDGSSDNTFQILSEIASYNKRIRIIKLTNNFGHQGAILCGMTNSDADILITIDCDLQDDINVIPEMVKKHNETGCEVVYGVRTNRQTDTFLKRTTANLYYKISLMLGVKGLDNHADFRLVTKKVANIIKQYPERNIYLRGLIYSLRLKYEIVNYARKTRIGGSPKYSFMQSFNLAVNAITSSSVTIDIIVLTGLLFAFLSLILHSLVLFVGGLNLAAIGIIGEYIYKAFVETKARPNYIIEEKVNYEE